MAGTELNQIPALVLHTRAYQEHSLLVDFYGLNCGRVRAVARGARRVKSPLKFLLQPFQPLKINLSRRRGELYTLHGASAAGARFEPGLPRIFSASYLNELLYYLTSEDSGDPELFGAYLRALEELAGTVPERLVLRRFETVLLQSLGYAPRYETAEGAALTPQGHYSFVPGRGFCEGERGTLEGSRLIAIARGELDDPRALSTLGLLHRSILGTLLGTRPLKSRELYETYVGQVADGKLLS